MAIREVDIPVGFRFYRESIVAAATEHGLDPVIVAAVCWQESAFRADAFRFEPDFWNRYLKGNPLYAHLNPRRVSSSYGLMQTMYCRLLEDRIKDNDAWPPEDLFEPEKNLLIGCMFLADLYRWAQSLGVNDAAVVEQAALASYNGGRGGNNPLKNLPLRNGRYAREVLEKAAVLRKVMG